MLLLTGPSLLVNGIAVYPDFSDPNQFWYFPGPVHLSKGDDGEPIFTLIKYRPAAIAAGKGGGFLTLQVDLSIDDTDREQILGAVSALAPGEAQLSPVPFDDGTVQCLALNLQGPGGTSAPAASGTFEAVLQILGAGTPSLEGDNRACFSLTLDQAGATILDQAFAAGGTPVGVLYKLSFTGMRPAFKVRITADFARIYSEFSVGLSAQVYWVRAGIDAVFDKLRQDGTIKVDVQDFTGQADQAAKEQWALDFFKDKLLTDWFEPSLNPALAGTAAPVVGTGPTGTTRPPGGTSTGTGAGSSGTPRPGGSTTPPPTPTPPAGGTTPPPTPTPPAGGTTPPPTPTPPAGGATPPPAGSPGPPTPHPAPAPTPPPRPTPPAAPGGGAPGSRPPTGPSNGLATGQGDTALVSLKLRYVSQDELKTVALEYDRAEAAQRVYAPQGFISALTAELDPARHVIDVDLDDPFFRSFDVAVSAPVNFADLAITDATVSIDYGPADDPANVKHGELRFDSAHTATQTFSAYSDAAVDTTYRRQVVYHFDGASDWQAAADTVTVPEITTGERTVVLNPYENLTFLTVSLVPARIDSHVVTSTDVLLTFTDATGWSQSSTLTVTASSAPQRWRVRAGTPGEHGYSYQFTHHLADGTTRTSDVVHTTATTVPVNDPFTDALEIDFVPDLDPSVREAIVEVTYDDQTNDYHRSERLTLTPKSTDTQLRLALLDPTQRTFSYRVTLIGINEAVTQSAFRSTTDTLVLVDAAAAAAK